MQTGYTDAQLDHNFITCDEVMLLSSDGEVIRDDCPNPTAKWLVRRGWAFVLSDEAVGFQIVE